jgi:hypothetical protein
VEGRCLLAAQAQQQQQQQHLRLGWSRVLFWQVGLACV